MSRLFICLAIIFAGLLGITLSLPLQAPALIFLGVASLLAAALTFRRQYDLRLLIPVLMALVYFSGRAWYSPVVDLATEDLFLIAAASILYLVAGPVNGSPRTRVALAAAVLLLLSFHLGSALMQCTGDAGYSWVWHFTGGGKPEGNAITGMYGYRGSFANFAGMAGVLALCLGVWGRFSAWLRISLCALAGVAIVLAVIANSRSAMISLAAGGLVFWVLLWVSVAGQKESLKSRFHQILIIFGGLAVIALPLVVMWVFQQRAQQSVHGSDVMFDSGVRLAFWPMALEQWSDYPLIGAGSRSFSYECFHYWSPNLDTGEANPEFVHNEYLQLLADYGMIGFLLVGGLLGAHFVMGVRRVKTLSDQIKEGGFRQGSNAMALAIAGVVGIVIMAVHVVFDFRTHLMANLLLLVCCFVWVLPISKAMGSGVKMKQRLMQWILCGSLLGLGAGALYAGVVQLRGGIPLMKNKMAVETGSWSPDRVPRDIWIPSLEQATSIAPSYRRYLKLGTLYRLEADDLEGEERIEMLKRAISSYERVIERHAYEPVSHVNLASIYTSLGDYENADAHFEQANKLGAARERWFRIHIKWADMQRVWAGSLWVVGDTVSAERHFQRAFEILEQGVAKSGDTTMVRLMVMVEYTRMLDSVHQYEMADALFENAVGSLPVYVMNSLKQNIRREMGEHYLRKGKYLWYKRQPEKAYQALMKAERSFRIHQVVLQKREDGRWKKGYDEVKEILKFLKTTGIAPDQKNEDR